MEPLLIIAIIALFTWIGTLSSKLNKLKNTIDYLNDEFRFMYDKLSSGRNNTTQLTDKKTDSAVPQDAYAPPASTKEATTQVEQNTVKETTGPALGPRIANESRYPRMPQDSSQNIKVKKEPVSIEKWLGRNVIGVAASALIFIGLVFFGILVYDYLSDAVKLIIMFSISVLMTGLGIFLTQRRSNAFTAILTSCGCGSLFISILLTHIYFDYISDIAALSLIAVWMAATLYLSKRINSMFVSIVAHMGMVYSICFAFFSCMNDEKLAIVLIYQAVSIAVILIGNLLCFKKTYRFGLIISLILSVTASFFMLARFTGGDYFHSSVLFPATTVPTALLLGAFALQFLCASFLSYLLAVSSSRLKNMELMLVTHIINKALWIIALVINITYVTHRFVWFLYGYANVNRYITMFITVAISSAILLLHSFLSSFMEKKLNFNRMLSTMSVLMMSCVAGVMFFLLWSTGTYSGADLPNISWFILIGIVLIVAERTDRKRSYMIAGNIFVGLDLLFMLIGGFRELEKFTSLALPIGYIGLYLLVIWGQWLLRDAKERQVLSMAARIITFLTVELSLVSIFIFSAISFNGTILLLILTILGCLMYYFKYDRSDTNDKTALGILLEVNELIILFICALCISFVHKSPTESILYYLITIFAFLLAFLRIGPVLRGKAGTRLEILAGIKFTVLVLAVVNGNSDWFDKTYILSLVCMATAFLCIIVGFIIKSKSLRLYGLILTLVCVLKLVTFDVSELNTILRVVSFIGGGIICFITSLIYNTSEKKLNGASKD